MYVGTYDKLVVPEDAEWLRDQLGDTVVHYAEYPLGHGTFVIGKDMTWFTQDAMKIISQYNQ